MEGENRSATVTGDQGSSTGSKDPADIPFGDTHKEYQRLQAIQLAVTTGFSWYHSKLWFDGYHKVVEPSLKRISRTFEGGLQSIILTGPVGTGKTGLLSAMVKEFFIAWASTQPGPSRHCGMYMAPRILVLTHSDLVDLWHSMLDADQPAPIDPRTVPLLVLDDLGDANETEFNIARLKELIDYRWKNDLPTWISTNYKGKQLESSYGKALSRIRDQRWMVPFAIEGNDRREAEKRPEKG